MNEILIEQFMRESNWIEGERENPKTGRLIWLHKAIEEGYEFKNTFLQEYYYQTLNKFNE